VSDYESKALVMGASGFIGSHVIKGLVQQGRDVRIFYRESSDTSATDHLDVERVVGDIRNKDDVRAAIEGCDAIYYCVVDARAWLKDPAPLAEINIDAFRQVMDVALELKVKRFIYTSSIITIGTNVSGVASEEDAFNWWDQASEYARVRVDAENMLFDYCKRGLPAISCNAPYTYGAGDSQPTPHGWMIKMVVEGKFPCGWDVSMPAVGIQDVADGMILAEKHGRVGERYLLTDHSYSLEELHAIASEAVGRKPNRLKIPVSFVWIACWLNENFNWLFGRDTSVTMKSFGLMCILKDYDNSKARKELGWNPRPVEESITECARWYQAHPEIPNPPHFFAKE
jgi:dihydroflavonol-4-reductase